MTKRSSPKAMESAVVPVGEETYASIVKRAEQGEKEAKLELQRRVAEGRAWNTPFGNVGALAEWALVNAFCESKGKVDVEREACMNHKIKVMKVELLGEDPSPLERILVDRIVLCWMQANLTTVMDVCSDKLNARSAAEYQNKRQERSHRLFLSAVKALAQVRRLQAPSVQVNIAERQVNVG